MNKCAILVIGILAAITISGCQQNNLPNEKQNLNFNSIGLEFQESDTAKPAVRDFDLRVFDEGIDPDTIVVNKGDTVRIQAWNMRREIARNASNTFFTFPFVNFEMHERGNGLIAEFVAEESGEFIFGDERAPNRMGRLIVT